MAKKKSDAVKDIHSLGDMKFDDHNANKGTAKGKKLVGESIGEYGAGRSIVADKNGKVIGGNKTLQAAIDAGMDVEVIRSSGEKLIVHQRADLDLDEGDKARLLAYADNRSSEVGLDWDVDVLSGDIAAGIDLSGMFDDKTLEGIGVDMGEPEEPPEAQMDAAEALQEKWQVKDGDVWQIGEHRLMCGDNSGAVDFAGDTKIDMVFTDPPYGVISEEWDRLFNQQDLDLLHELTTGPILVWNAIRPDIFKSMLSLDPICERIAVWRMTSGIKGKGGMFWTWQPIFCWNCKSIKLWDSCEFQSDNPTRTGQHPTQKPVGVIEKWIGSADNIKTIFDPFLGSGTTMVAAEQLGRKCYGMEIEPKYCAVILERMSDMGLTPELVENARG